jgi:predicted esterase
MNRRATIHFLLWSAGLGALGCGTNPPVEPAPTAPVASVDTAGAGGSGSAPSALPGTGGIGIEAPPMATPPVVPAMMPPMQTVDAGADDAGDAGGGDAGNTNVGGSTTATNEARAKGTTDAKNGFWEYLPIGYGGSIKSPLLVFWHGIGEDGSGSLADLGKVPKNGPPRLIKDGSWNAALPLVVLSPQHGPSGCPSADEIHDFIAFALTHYEVDPDRVYVSGVSCGALGSAGYLAKYGGEQVVAAVLVAGNADPIWNAKGCGLLTDVALWALHGNADSTVSINGDNSAMPKFMACPQPRRDAQYTVYPGVGHDSWTRTFDLSAGNDVYSWMLGITR